MHYLQIFSLFVATVASTGFTIPSDQPNGVYTVTYDAEGRAIHTLIGSPVNHTEGSPNPLVSRSPNKLSLLARQADAVHCGGYDLNRPNTDNAVEALKNQCSPGAIGGNLNFYSISGSTVAYVCNYNGAAVACTRNEIGESADRITGVCGSYRAGWRNLVRDGRNIQIGYENTGSKFCGRGTLGN
ncbi:hypothetical protein B0J11DRAFT_506596 [Dendryphion nanum]|uniref:Uncharacterized protein n=1 Tax=Dendryphion nanum TaxID=256645 RepID=A0A9P9DR60_9PLEO|nr:hypothetical protein B0J11DRAFT_506596 [Dendryphion nanum]